MARIGQVPEIVGVKTLMDGLKREGLIKEWELPYENILTRLSAAIFFVDARSDETMDLIRDRLKSFPDVRYRENQERRLSQLRWRVDFAKE